jgi:hypothetical protein
MIVGASWKFSGVRSTFFTWHNIIHWVIYQKFETSRGTERYFWIWCVHEISCFMILNGAFIKFIWFPFFASQLLLSHKNSADMWEYPRITAKISRPVKKSTFRGDSNSGSFFLYFSVKLSFTQIKLRNSTILTQFPCCYGCLHEFHSMLEPSIAFTDQDMNVRLYLLTIVEKHQTKDKSV